MTDRDYSAVSEAPGIGVTQENAQMLYTRYEFARQVASGKDVLEVACGAGIGLGFVGRAAKSVVGADIDPQFVAAAREHYGDRVRIDESDALALPYADGSFDVVLLLEAVYFLPDFAQFVREAKRVLRTGGILVLVSANREWTSFNPSERATRYYSLGEIRNMLSSEGFTVETYKGFADRPDGLKGRVLGLARKVVVALHLIPDNMKGKELMKRMAYGKLVSLPQELTEGFSKASIVEPHEGSAPVPDYKVIYARGRLSS